MYTLFRILMYARTQSVVARILVHGRPYLGVHLILYTVAHYDTVHGITMYAGTPCRVPCTLLHGTPYPSVHRDTLHRSSMYTVTLYSACWCRSTVFPRPQMYAHSQTIQTFPGLEGFLRRQKSKPFFASRYVSSKPPETACEWLEMLNTLRCASEWFCKEKEKVSGDAVVVSDGNMTTARSSQTRIVGKVDGQFLHARWWL